MQQLSGLDASFIYSDTAKAPQHIFTCLIYDPSSAPGGTLTFKAILEHYRRRLHTSRVFRQKLARVPLGLDHPYWVDDDDFDLEYHVRHIALPQPGDWRQLCIQLARLQSRPLDPTRPLWEATVIEGLDNVDGIPRGSFAVMQKIHHAAIDGVTSLEIMASVHDQVPDPVAPGPDVAWQPEPPPNTGELVARAMSNSFTRPARFARLVGRQLPGGTRAQDAQLRQRLQIPQMVAAPRTRFSGIVSPHRVIDARRYDLAEIRRVKSAVPGATVNDVVIAIVGGALRQYLDDKGELPGTTLRVMVPISTRTPEQAGTAGNQVSVMVADLGTDIADARARLVAVHDSTTASKAASEAVDATVLTSLAEMMPGNLAVLGARLASQFETATRTTPIVNTVVSNVPGPQVPLYFAGARLVTFFGGAAVVDGMGLLHGITSYCGEVVISIVSDREMLPDPAVYADCLDRSHAALVAATIETRPAGRSARRSGPALWRRPQADREAAGARLTAADQRGRAAEVACGRGRPHPAARADARRRAPDVRTGRDRRHECRRRPHQARDLPSRVAVVRRPPAAGRHGDVPARPRRLPRPRRAALRVPRRVHRRAAGPGGRRRRARPRRVGARRRARRADRGRLPPAHGRSTRCRRRPPPLTGGMRSVRHSWEHCS